MGQVINPQRLMEASMRKRWSAGVSTVLLAAVALFATVPTQAADHLDSPRTQGDASADINDVYVFRGTSADLGAEDTTVLIMTVFPVADAAARFSPNVDYVFNVVDAADSANSWTITCTAAGDPQMITCDTGTVSDTVAFNAVEAGTPSNETMRIFAGLRDDPFFFDLSDFNAVLDSVLAGAPDATPLVDGADDAADFFAPLNTLAIVVEIDNSVWGSSTTLNVSATTVRNAQDQ